MPNRLSTLRSWELDSNSTRWDVLSASPSDDVMHLRFALLATINTVVVISCALLIISILYVRKVRQRAFNMYLLSITIPDFASSFSCLITCAMSSASYTYYSEQMCGWQAWYLVWGFASTSWMNAVIAHQVYNMLRISHRRGRYNPPTRKQVTLHTGCVYLYGAILASLTTWNVIPQFKVGSYQGLYCFPKAQDAASELIFWLVFVPAFFALPLTYYMWCCKEILRMGLLPPVGLRRELALYFFRIAVAFLVMWVPCIVVVYIIPNENSWIGWTGAAWSHTQGLVSVLVSLTKPDIKKAFLETFRWKRSPNRASNVSDDHELASGMNNDDRALTSTIPVLVTDGNRNSDETNVEVEDEEGAGNKTSSRIAQSMRYVGY